MGENNTAYKPTVDMSAALDLQAGIKQKILAEQAAEAVKQAPPEAKPGETAPPEPTSKPAEAAKPQTAEHPGEPAETQPKPLSPEEEAQKARAEAGALTSTWMNSEADRIAQMKEKKRTQGEQAILTVRGFMNIAEGTAKITSPIDLTGENAQGTPLSFTKKKKGGYEFNPTGIKIEQIIRFEKGHFICKVAGTSKESRISRADFIALSIQAERNAIIAHATTKSEQMGAVIAATIAPDTQTDAPPLSHDRVEAAARSAKLISTDSMFIILSKSGVSRTIQENVLALIGEKSFVDTKTTAKVLFQLGFHNSQMKDMDAAISTVRKKTQESQDPAEIAQLTALSERLSEKKAEIEAQIAELGDNEEKIIANLEGSLNKMGDAEFTTFVGALVDDDKTAAFEALLENVPPDQREKFKNLLEGTAKYGSIAALAMIVLIVMQAAGGDR